MDTVLVALLNAHKDEPDRRVTVGGNAHLGQTSQTFHVQVPPGAGPGQTLQAQAPNGVTLQVQIPQGSAPGTTFEVATPAMPVDVTVAPPTAQVSPAPMEMERATAWECETDTGWSEYGADIAAQLESAFGARAAVSWNTHGFSYSVDWDRMQQVNEKTGRRRGIRRSAI